MVKKGTCIKKQKKLDKILHNHTMKSCGSEGIQELGRRIRILYNPLILQIPVQTTVKIKITDTIYLMTL